MRAGRTKSSLANRSHERAWRGLKTALGLYGRNFGIFTALALFPAITRLAYFLDAPWMTGAVSGLVELLVAGCRIALLFVALRAAWPQDLAALKGALTQAPILSRISWQEFGWQILIFVLVIYGLNLGAGWLARVSSSSPELQTANLFVLKNLFIIPFETLYLLVAARMVLRI